MAFLINTQVFISMPLQRSLMGKHGCVINRQELFTFYVGLNVTKGGRKKKPTKLHC